MFDYHIHSNVSHDAYDSPVRVAMAAKEKGFAESICLQSTRRSTIRTRRREW